MAPVCCEALHVILVTTRMEILIAGRLLILAQTTGFRQTRLRFAPIVQLKLSVKHIPNSYFSLIIVFFLSISGVDIIGIPDICEMYMTFSGKNR